ncbi:MAG: hypothetical protein A2X37_10780 [Elusimicrobia bacterium GWA2_66_18]|nr:MAG: hypothetical protein A2X37_10780 [Elusimicrobia bacterium GWA2_66_18]
MIRIPNTRNENSLYNAVEFVSRAQAKTDVRRSMIYFYKEGDFLLASDGHRLHTGILKNVVEHEVEAWLPEDGAYEIISKNRKELIISKVEGVPDFPRSWMKVFAVKDFDFTETVAGGKYPGVSKAVCDTLRMCPENQHFDMDYMTDVFKSGFSETWTILMGGELMPCLMKNSYKAAAVMPIRA